MILSSEYICPQLQPQKFELTPMLVVRIQKQAKISKWDLRFLVPRESGFQSFLAAMFRDREFALYRKEILFSVALTNQPAVGESAR